MNSMGWPKGWYQLRKAADLCCGSWTCKRPRSHGVFCEVHQRNRVKAQKTATMKRYLAHKLGGICVGRGATCKSPQPADTLLCASCTEENAANARRYRRSYRGRAKRRAHLKRWRKARIERGMCVRCDKELATETLCEEHRQEMRRRVCALQGRVWEPKVAKRAQAPMLPVEHYAAARMAVDL